MSAQINPQTTFANPLNNRRVTFGITDAHGKRVAIVLEKTSDDAYAPLAPVLDPPPAVISGIETDGSDDADPTIPTEHAPTERELDELYLTCAGWTRVEILRGFGDVWEDPIGGGAFAFADAMRIQDRREEMESRAATSVATI